MGALTLSCGVIWLSYILILNGVVCPIYVFGNKQTNVKPTGHLARFIAVDSVWKLVIQLVL